MEHEIFYSNLFPNSYIASCIVLFKSSRLTRFENDYQRNPCFVPLESSIKKCSPNTHTPTDLRFKNWRRKHTRWTEPRRDRSAHAKLASASGPTHHPPTSTSGRCQVTDEASSYASLQRRRRNPDKGAKEATRRQSSLLAPRSRFSRCKDHSECQITARQRRQRLFLHFPFDEGKGTVADKLVTTSLSLSKLGYIFFTLVENEENSVTGNAIKFFSFYTRE